MLVHHALATDFRNAHLLGLTSNIPTGIEYPRKDPEPADRCGDYRVSKPCDDRSGNKVVVSCVCVGAGQDSRHVDIVEGLECVLVSTFTILSLRHPDHGE